MISNLGSVSNMLESLTLWLASSFSGNKTRQNAATWRRREHIYIYLRAGGEGGGGRPYTYRDIRF